MGLRITHVCSAGEPYKVYQLTYVSSRVQNGFMRAPYNGPYPEDIHNPDNYLPHTLIDASEYPKLLKINQIPPAFGFVVIF